MTEQERLLREKVRRLWRLALQHDGIDSGVKFVILSGDNPFKEEYDNAVNQFIKYHRIVSNSIAAG